MATIEVDSEPGGAEVLADKKLLGKTPLKLAMPISDLPVTFELKLSGYRKLTKQVVITGNRVIDLPLEKAPVASSPHEPSHHHGSGSDTGLMRPDDL
jgi:hypothetical protein